MTYLPIIPMLLDKDDLSNLSSFPLPVLVYFFFFVDFLDQVGWWGWVRTGVSAGGRAGLSAVHTYFFSAMNDTESPLLRIIDRRLSK